MCNETCSRIVFLVWFLVLLCKSPEFLMSELLIVPKRKDFVTLWEVDPIPEIIVLRGIPGLWVKIRTSCTKHWFFFLDITVFFIKSFFIHGIASSWGPCMFFLEFLESDSFNIIILKNSNYIYIYIYITRFAVQIEIAVYLFYWYYWLLIKLRHKKGVRTVIFKAG